MYLTLLYVYQSKISVKMTLNWIVSLPTTPRVFRLWVFLSQILLIKLLSGDWYRFEPYVVHRCAKEVRPQCFKKVNLNYIWKLIDYHQTKMWKSIFIIHSELWGYSSYRSMLIISFKKLFSEHWWYNQFFCFNFFFNFVMILSLITDFLSSYWLLEFL